jgi:hypothetical protein
VYVERVRRKIDYKQGYPSSIRFAVWAILSRLIAKRVQSLTS